MKSPSEKPAGNCAHPRHWRKRSTRRILAGLAAGALSAGLLAACSSSSSGGTGGSASSGGSGSTYTIHAILAVTGSNAFLGDDEKASLQSLQKLVNSSGGIDGHPVNFAISDNQSTAATSVSLASPLLSQVPVLIVGSATATDRPVDQLATSGSPVIYDLSPGDHPAVGSAVYSASNSTTNQTLAFANFAKAKGWSRVAAITSTDSSGQDGWTNINAAVQGTGGAVSVTSHQTFDPTAVSVTTQLSKIKATNPQAIFIWTTGTPLTTVLAGMQQLGMSGIPVLTSNGNESYKQMQSLGSQLPDQVYFPSSQFRLSGSALSATASTLVSQFNTAMKGAGQPVPDEGDALVWDPALLIINALKKLGVGATAEQIHQYISAQSDYVGISGTYDFTSKAQKDNRGLTIQSVYVTQWDKSKGDWVQASGPAGTSLVSPSGSASASASASS
ncbi:MAG TPA: ABC transporter substrate-binding protein [Trebonia sp.]|nr:ABC transporter substrate-binding protein [Trebonia sp.]